MGYLAGYAIKKLVVLVTKMVAVAVGLFVAVEACLIGAGVITVNLTRLSELAQQGIVYTQQAVVILSKVGAAAITYTNAMPIGGAFSLGLIAGFSKSKNI